MWFKPNTGRLTGSMSQNYKRNQGLNKQVFNKVNKEMIQTN